MGLGRRFAVISSAMLCWMVDRSACNAWLCWSASLTASSSEIRADAGCVVGPCRGVGTEVGPVDCWPAANAGEANSAAAKAIPFVKW